MKHNKIIERKRILYPLPKTRSSSRLNHKHKLKGLYLNYAWWWAGRARNGGIVSIRLNHIASYVYKTITLDFLVILWLWLYFIMLELNLVP